MNHLMVDRLNGLVRDWSLSTKESAPVSVNKLSTYLVDHEVYWVHSNTDGGDLLEEIIHRYESSPHREVTLGQLLASLGYYLPYTLTERSTYSPKEDNSTPF